ncbi:hypothetical protein [Halococcus sp. IIIV-5B]|uniref:hypothetical protein n=1 Tax=Halococcus sp. IIIV-5B TaxID=2321230 RepID=UPI000E721937|nr:hypothetical protein D3261_10140 [Halococcus sp. IIIV-5B]
MYSLRQLRRVIDQPKLFVREMNRLYYTRLGRRSYDPDGIDITAADWDNLLILDACRYDMFAARADELPGVLEQRRSRASMTTEFLKANIDGRELHDIVYVAATPMLYWNRNRGEVTASFHHEINVWRDGWDDEVHTVRPETTAEYAARAADEYPNKRLLVHFVQPHFPAVGPTGEEYPELRSMRVWDALDRGDIDLPDSVLWRAFRENLDAVLPHVDDLLKTLDGRTVVTADHGQMIGERSFPIPFREYGHPPGIYTHELLTVPWLVSTNGPRRETFAEEPVAPPERGDETEPADMETDDDVVTDRLEDLGYIV